MRLHALAALLVAVLNSVANAQAPLCHQYADTWKNRYTIEARLTIFDDCRFHIKGRALGRNLEHSGKAEFNKQHMLVISLPSIEQDGVGATFFLQREGGILVGTLSYGFLKPRVWFDPVTPKTVF
jgi:hypothetical protein